MRSRKTDYGTIILHWLLVGATLVALATGLRIATETPDREWINWFDGVLPRAHVWVPHMQAAVALVAVAVGHTVYLIRSGLSRRVTLDHSRLRGLLGRSQARLGSINVLLTWAFFLTMLMLIVSGGMLYFGILAGHAVAMLHWYGTWLVLGFAGLHILTHYRLGGVSQLMRIFRPQGLPTPPPKLDAVELLAMLVEQSERLGPQADFGGPPGPLAPLQPAAPSRPRAEKPRNPTLQANPLVVSAAVAVTFASVVVASDRLSVDSLTIHRIATADRPIVDGDTSDPVWRNIEPFSLMTNDGGNFDGRGESRVEIRAVHDGTWAYFQFTWQDPTRSLKQLPLIKEIDGWHLLHHGFEAGDEHDYSEDKFSVLFTTAEVMLAGDRTFHASPHPIADKPATMTGRGLHYTENGGYADVWEWKATSGGPTGWLDDAHFGPPLDPTPMQAADRAPYRGGFAADPGSANYADNFAADAKSAGLLQKPRRLPRDLAATLAAMGQISLDPNIGESDGARWFMTEAESVAYTPELDRLIPTGTIIPGIILGGEFAGDRADVRGAARWASGHWALEVARRLDTRSRYDVALKSGVFMRVAAFDHSQIRHTRHVRPIRIEVE